MSQSVAHFKFFLIKKALVKSALNELHYSYKIESHLILNFFCYKKSAPLRALFNTTVQLIFKIFLIKKALIKSAIIELHCHKNKSYHNRTICFDKCK